MCLVVVSGQDYSERALGGTIESYSYKQSAGIRWSSVEYAL